MPEPGYRFFALLVPQHMNCHTPDDAPADGEQGRAVTGDPWGTLSIELRILSTAL